MCDVFVGFASLNRLVFPRVVGREMRGLENRWVVQRKVSFRGGAMLGKYYIPHLAHTGAWVLIKAEDMNNGQFIKLFLVRCGARVHVFFFSCRQRFVVMVVDFIPRGHPPS